MNNMHSIERKPYLYIRTLIACVLPAFLLLTLLWRPAQADSLEVPCVPAQLVSAILIANGNAAIDTLVLTPNCIYEFSAQHSNENALPTITGGLTIEGNGATLLRTANVGPFRLLEIGGTSAVTLRNLSFEGGDVPVNSGGAIYADLSAPLTLTNVNFTNNQAEKGGALYTLGDSLAITNGRFTNNHAVDGDGGAISSQSTLTVVNTQFVENTAADDGGAIKIFNSAITIRGSQFQQNRAADGDGGAIWVFAPLTLESTVFNGNFAGVAGGAVIVFDTLNGSDLQFVNNEQNPLNDEKGGGAIYSEADITLRRVAFSNNTAFRGAGIYQNDEIYTVDIREAQFFNNQAAIGGALYPKGTLTLQTSSFVDNGADWCGAIRALGNATIERTSFTSNVAVTTYGGALCAKGPQTTVSNSQFQSNRAKTNGGAIWTDHGNNQNAALHIDNSIFQDNEATTEWGGAIYSAGPPIVLETSTLQQNRAVDGGAVYTEFITRIARNKFIRNQASQNGGALYIHDQQCTGAEVLTSQNNLWIDNAADAQGAALYIELLTDASAGLRHETIVGPADSQAPNQAIYVADGLLELTNSIIANHAIGVEVQDNEVGDGELRSAYNLYVGNGTDFNTALEERGDITVDPLFVDAANGDYRLQPDSPAINSGMDAGVTDDYDGNGRPVGAGFDRGAFEYQGDDPQPTATPAPPTATPTATAPAIAEPTSTPSPTSTPPAPTSEPTPGTPTAVPTNEPTAQPGEPTPTVQPTATVVPDVPIAGLTASNSGPVIVGNAVSFSATVASGSNVSYIWNFGDGTVGAGVSPGYVYAQPGSYVARVVASNGVSQATAETLVTVNPAPAEDAPISNLVVRYGGEMVATRSIDFVAQVDGGSNILYEWDFGDGIRASGPVASHSYSEPGTYIVRVRASNRVSSSESELTVTIEPLPGGTTEDTRSVFLPLVTRQ